MAKPHLPYLDRLETASQLTVRARIFLDVWWFYEGPTRGKILSSLNVYSEFFRFDIHAHFVSFVVHIAALFENGRKTINIPQLIDEAEQSGNNRDAIDSVRSHLRDVRDLIPKVIILRSNLFAHRSAKLTYEQVFKDAKITADQLRSLSETSYRIMEILTKDTGVAPPFINNIAVGHLKGLIDGISNCKSV